MFALLLEVVNFREWVLYFDACSYLQMASGVKTAACIPFPLWKSAAVWMSDSLADPCTFVNVFAYTGRLVSFLQFTTISLFSLLPITENDATWYLLLSTCRACRACSRRPGSIVQARAARGTASSASFPVHKRPGEQDWIFNRIQLYSEKKKYLIMIDNYRKWEHMLGNDGYLVLDT